MDVPVDEITLAALAARDGDQAAAARFVRATQADVWRLCLIDMSEALQVASTSEAPPPGGVTPRPAPDKEPTQAPEDEDPLGLGALLEGLFGG